MDIPNQEEQSVHEDVKIATLKCLHGEPDDGNPYNFDFELEKDSDKYLKTMVNTSPDMLAKSIDTRPELFFTNELITNHIKDIVMIETLANLLSGKSAQIICRRLFKGKYLEDFSMEMFLDRFLPTYFQRCCSWVAIDLMVRARVSRHKPFLKFLQTLFKLSKISKEILYDYVVNVDDSKRQEVLEVFTTIELKMLEFIHHLKTINFLLMYCTKRNIMFVCLLDGMRKFGSHCAYAKDYGKLLLSVIEHIENITDHYEDLKKLITDHKSSFKLICQEALYCLADEDGEVVLRPDNFTEVVMWDTFPYLDLQ